MTTLDDLVGRLRPHERIYVAGSAGEPPGLMDAIARAGPPLDVTTSFVPGVNALAPERFAPGTRFAGPFALGAAAGAQADGTIRHLPLSYGAFVRHALTRLEIDTCFVHVSPPGPDGRHSLGPSAEFTALVAARAGRVFAVVNAQLPVLPHAPSFAASGFAALARIDAPLAEYDVGAPSEAATRIATRIADHVDDGATVQVGLGKVPDALMRLIGDRKRLRLYSGLLSEGARALSEAGSLDPAFRHTATAFLGSQGLYSWLAGREDFAARGCDETHDLARLLRLPRFVAVNSAVSVDLFGQANLETLGARQISGVGGAAEFARAAAQSADGVSVCALVAVAGAARASRIVPTLGPIVSLPRHDIDILVTEHGLADLRGLDARARAHAIVETAAPEHRAALREAAGTMLAAL